MVMEFSVNANEFSVNGAHVKIPELGFVIVVAAVSGKISVIVSKFSVLVRVA